MTNSLKRGLIEKRCSNPSKSDREGERRLFEFLVNRMKLHLLVMPIYIFVAVARTTLVVYGLNSHPGF
jgi:hypothetical protein